MIFRELIAGIYYCEKTKVIPVNFLFIFFIFCSSNPNYYLRAKADFPEIKKIAVLPFRNITSQREAGKIVANIFVKELFNSNTYEIEEMGNIREFFIRQRIRKIDEIDFDILSMLNAQLGIDAVIIGTVEEYYKGAETMGEVSPKLGISARMLSTKNGTILWKCYHERSGDDYIIVLNIGKVRTIDLLAQKTINEMIATINKSGK